ncbi:ABC-2 transporter permease [Companilactobacillus metriopterae]|uniref:ABC-2 transporter permease n=1 Tax=Companilactobacillus metriopterae TaxID=1909267 RepID=UPI00100BFDC0|nr:ABC-2 transporter permease [Companilactobacillus metriopterae]
MINGLILKDFIVFKKSITSLKVILPIGILLVLNLLLGKNGSNILNILIGLLVFSLSFSSYDEDTEQWELFTYSSKISNLILVSARYIFLISIMLLSVLFVYLLNISEYLLFNVESLHFINFLMLVILLLFSTVVIIFTPLIYLVGLNNVQIIMIGIFGIVFVLFKFLKIPNWMNNLFSAILSNNILMLLIIISLFIVLGTISFFMSVFFAKKRSLNNF